MQIELNLMQIDEVERLKGSVGLTRAWALVSGFIAGLVRAYQIGIINWSN